MGPTPGPTPKVSRRTQHARELFAGLPASYDRMGALLSFGQDARWRLFLVSRLAGLPARSRVLDVATGTGLVATELVRRTGARVIALDQSAPMLAEGVRRASGNGLAHRIAFLLGRGEELPFGDATFDGVTVTYLLRYVDDPAGTVAELARVLRPGGTMAALEFHVPRGVPWRAAWLLYTRAVMPLVGRAASAAWYEVGRFLGPSISDFYRRNPLPDQLEWWRAAGIADVGARPMGLGASVVTWGTKHGS